MPLASHPQSAPQPVLGIQVIGVFESKKKITIKVKIYCNDHLYDKLNPLIML